jgi:flagellar protein FlaG
MEIGSIKSTLDSLPLKSTDFAKETEFTKVEGLKPAEAKPLESQNEAKEKNEEKISEAVDKLNKTAVIFDRSLRFQVHDKTHRTMVSVVDITSDKVIRQIPSEEVLDLVAKMDDYLGLIFDKKA